ncbi:putative alpha-1,3-mannosyltransferase [Xylogone sp. PMI_703]|nr:putative alpha-1,3-mannosyltransferase [Xylogone sp. PMI_703]
MTEQPNLLADTHTGNDIKGYADKLQHNPSKSISKVLPDDTSYPDLIRPIEDTNLKKQLRQIAVRMREFKTYFNVWKEVHLVVDHTGFAYVRDDIIQLLRCRMGNDHRRLSSLIQRYEAFGWLLTRIGNLLFPWTTFYFPNALSLYTHIHNGGRGIVTTAGDKQAPWLLTSIPMIRRLGCSLPIEIMYMGDEDLGSDLRDELERLPGVIVRNLKQLVNEDLELKGFSIKPFALLLSSFREAILLDADAIMFQNPEVLFQDPDYTKYGALFFHDRILSIEDRRLRFSQPVFFHDQGSIARHGRRWLLQTLPEPISEKVKQNRMWTGNSRQVQESGVVVVDKKRHFLALLVVTYINGPGRTGFYNMFYGDKESYWIGWELAGDVDYAFHPGELAVPGVIFQYSQEDSMNNQNILKHSSKTLNGTGRQTWKYDSDITVCSPQLLHLDRDGNPLWFNGWILTDKFEKTNQSLVNFQGYMPEPPKLKDPEAWQIGDHNLACLSNDRTFEFTRRERTILDETIKTAVDVGSYVPGTAPPRQTDFY